jgi:hypothetical protein
MHVSVAGGCSWSLSFASLAATAAAAVASRRAVHKGRLRLLIVQGAVFWQRRGGGRAVAVTAVAATAAVAAATAAVAAATAAAAAAPANLACANRPSGAPASPPRLPPHLCFLPLALL